MVEMWLLGFVRSSSGGYCMCHEPRVHVAMCGKCYELGMLGDMWWKCGCWVLCAALRAVTACAMSPEFMLPHAANVYELGTFFWLRMLLL